MINKKQIAKEGELRFASEFVRKNWRIFLPYGEDSPVDLLIEKDGNFKRIQVKSTQPINGAIHCRIKSSNNWQVKKYTKKEIDYFAIYDYLNKKGYLIPIEDMEGMTEAIMRLDKAKNNQMKGIRFAENYAYF
ncbi:MAG: group I intron-associated PD-(D/E)XK endonuclease [Nanoarchaeota archaeon]